MKTSAGPSIWTRLALVRSDMGLQRRHAGTRRGRDPLGAARLIQRAESLTAEAAAC